MSNTYHIVIDAYVIADSFEEAIQKYDAGMYHIDSHSFESSHGIALDTQEQYVRDCWDGQKQPDWSEIKDPDGEDYK